MKKQLFFSSIAIILVATIIALILQKQKSQDNEKLGHSQDSQTSADQLDGDNYQGTDEVTNKADSTKQTSYSDPTPETQQTEVSISAINPNGGAYTLDSKVPITWSVSGQPKSGSTVIISLISASSNSVIGTIATVSAQTSSFGWYGPVVTNSAGQKISASGDQYYKIRVSLYTEGKLISQDTTTTAFEYAYGGPPSQQ